MVLWKLRELLADSWFLIGQWFSDFLEMSLASRYLRIWNSAPSPGISQCPLPTGSFSECPEAQWCGIRYANERPMLLPFPPLCGRAHTTQSQAAPGTSGNSLPSKFRNDNSRVLLAVVRLLLLPKNGQRADCSCVSQEGGSSCNKWEPVLIALGGHRMAWGSRDLGREKNHSWPF